MRKGHGRGARTLAAGLLMGVAACATPQTASQERAAAPAVGAPNAAVAADTPSPEASLKVILDSLRANRAAGRTGTLNGIGFLDVAPAPQLVLSHGGITLMPSKPDLEAALQAVARRWRADRRRPVAVEVFQTAFGLIDRHVQAIRALGGGDLLLQTETDSRGAFSLTSVPEGRWLLVTDLVSPVSALLWAIPDHVIAGETTRTHVGNYNILVEGRKTEQDQGARGD